nr:hypothetical protein [Actinomycetes bacterium]
GYLRRAAERVLIGQRRLASAIAGGRPMYERPADRRFAHDSPGQALEKDWEKDWEKDQEAAMLLDPAARLGGDGTYVR